MGSGTDAAAAAGGKLHAQVIDDFKDQLLIALMARLADAQGNLSIPVGEVDATGRYVVAMAIRDGSFLFELRQKS